MLKSRIGKIIISLIICAAMLSAFTISALANPLVLSMASSQVVGGQALDDDDDFDDDDYDDYDDTPVTVPTPAPQTLQLRFVIGQVQYTRNGQTQIADAPPYIDRAYGRTMVPLRTVAEALGAIVNYDAATRTAGIFWAGTRLILDMDTELPGNLGKPAIVNGHAYIPLVYLEIIGAQIRWDNDAMAAILTR